MKTYTIIGGINGCGKSSFTGVLRGTRNDLGIIIDVDKLTAEQAGNPLTGGRTAVRKIRSCLTAGVCFTQETTLSSHQVVRTAKQAQEAGYFVRLYYVALDTVQESLNRIANRVQRGGHDIPTEVVLRRFADRWPSVEKVLPYCDEAEFYDNHNGFIKVAEYRNGEVLALGEYRPKWLRELQKHLADSL